MLGKWLKTAHIQDNNGLHDQHSLPYLGTIDWKEVMSAAREVGYPGDFTYEAHNSVRTAPDGMRDAAAQYAYATAQFLLKND